MKGYNKKNNEYKDINELKSTNTNNMPIIFIVLYYSSLTATKYCTTAIIYFMLNTTNHVSPEINELNTNYTDKKINLSIILICHV